MKILVAPDSFKESLKASEVVDHMAIGILKAIPDAVCMKLPLADGGEGTVDALVAATGGEIRRIRVKDPLMREIDSFFGIMGDGRTGVIEMAAASGLELLKPEERDPRITSTWGTGQLIRAAAEAGCRKIIIGIGGSATNDAGAGMARALGVGLKDAGGHQIGQGGGQLGKVEKIDLSGLDPVISRIEFIVASDVQNPLCGPDGASAVYGPQKGATEDMVKVLDENLCHFGKILEAGTGKKVMDMPRAGAAGGLGAGLVAFLGAEMRPGFEIISELTRLEEKVREANLVVTGEGKLDRQTRYGKTPHGVAQLAKKHGKPVIAVGGTLGEGYEILYEHGFDALFSIARGPVSLEEALREAGTLLESTCHAIFKSFHLGTLFK